LTKVLEAEGTDRADIQTDEVVSTKATEISTGAIQPTKWSKRKEKKGKVLMVIELQHCDIIKDEFWAQRRWILEEE